jgi:3-keto-5-aminohexanoate cleavage enzyme
VKCNQKLIVNLTPTGMIPTKEMTPHVPVSPNEIIEQVHECYEVGITMAHLHARDEDTGLPTYKKTTYEKIFEGIRKFCPDLVLVGSLSGRNFKEFEKRSQVIELRPDMASLTLSSMNFVKHASVNSPQMVQSLLEKMLEYGVRPEFEVFDLGMLNYGNYLIGKGLAGPPPYYFNLFFGNIAGLQVDLIHAGATIKDLPEDSYWSFGGVGPLAQFSINMIAIALGGGVRVGLEDSIHFDRDRKHLATNVGLIKRIHQVAEICNRPVMKPSEFGELGFYNPERP